MGQMLDDGTIIPSMLSLTSFGEYDDLGNQYNTALRQGEVTDIIYPSDERSVSKRYTEYRVSVQQKDGGETGATVEYPNCFVLNPFGGAADRMTYTLRSDPGAKTKEAGLGSKVLLLCLDGQASRAYIIGGIRSDEQEDKEDAGHHLLWEFNGVQASVNKDGEFKLTFGGATKPDGKLADGADASAAGTAFTMAKNGDLVIEHDGQKIALNHGQKSWTIEADGKIEEKAGQEMNLTGTTGMNLDTKGATKITSTLGTKIGGDAAVDYLYKGTTHRGLDAAKHSGMVAGLTATTSALGVLASLLMAAGGALQGVSVAHKVPVAGPIAGSIPLQAGATALQSCMGAVTAAITGLTSVITAISTFEGSAPTTLSLKNTTD